MKLFPALALLILLVVPWPSKALSEGMVGSIPALTVNVSLTSQSMRVYLDGAWAYEWPVSTARPGKITPKGSWKAKWLSRHHRSSRYNNAPMPFSIFYDGNFAVHGTDQVDRLGSPASAGCVRLHPDNAAILFAMAQEKGLENTVITISD